MIRIGLTGWGDHARLYQGVFARDKLKAYSVHFPTVEVDCSFYAIQPERNYRKWAHGRNTEGWRAGGANWRDVRYLYRDSRGELLEWKRRLGLLQEHTGRTCVLFYNNSGGDAADNAKTRRNCSAGDTGRPRVSWNCSEEPWRPNRAGHMIYYG